MQCACFNIHCICFQRTNSAYFPLCTTGYSVTWLSYKFTDLGDKNSNLGILTPTSHTLGISTSLKLFGCVCNKLSLVKVKIVPSKLEVHKGYAFKYEIPYLQFSQRNHERSHLFLCSIISSPQYYCMKLPWHLTYTTYICVFFVFMNFNINSKETTALLKHK